MYMFYWCCAPHHAETSCLNIVFQQTNLNLSLNLSLNLTNNNFCDTRLLCHTLH